ncbi:hypothetical protein N307_14553, partial [Dryobates pubescens]
MNSNCRDDIDLWNKGEIIAASIFTPGAVAAKALMQLNRISCWLAKQNNITSEILSDLATEHQPIRHATLQNRAVIVFLLPVHGHGCEDFDGICCMSLTDKFSSIHQRIKTLMGQTAKIQQDQTFFGLEKIFDGWSLPGWRNSLIKTGLLILLIAFLILLI